jgi:hypothetical protein
MEKYLSLALSVFLLTATANTAQSAGLAKGGATNNVVGGDRDRNGCIGSAGYIWSAEKQKCIRPWEPSMGMRHPSRPCMKGNSCGEDKRTAAEKKANPYAIPSKWVPSMGMRHPSRPCMKIKKCGKDKRSTADKKANPYDIKWVPSMGMRHPSRPCMKIKKCGKDKRSTADKKANPYDIPGK